jgi:hypothetical protein
MPLSRRSFLAAVMGAIAAPVVAPASKKVLVGDWFGAELINPETVWRNYMIWDSLTIQPGAVVDERLWHPPVPDGFIIKGISASFGAEDPYKSVAAAVQSVYMTMKAGQTNLLESNLSCLAPSFGHPMPLALPYRCDRRMDLGVYLNSLGPVKSDEPVTITVVLDGMACVNSSEAIRQYLAAVGTDEGEESEYRGPD